ncbi:MAG: Hsp20/alpha crystallin family protein [Gemmataceae bacterium]
MNDLQKSQSGQLVPETTRANYFSPRVDILETEEGLELFADMPGVKPEDAEIRYEQGELIVHGKVQPRYGDSPRFALGEYGVGDFYRTFTVKDVETDKISAELKNGVLRIKLPRAEALKPRKIAVKSE